MAQRRRPSCNELWTNFINNTFIQVFQKALKNIVYQSMVSIKSINKVIYKHVSIEDAIITLSNTILAASDERNPRQCLSKSLESI